MKKVSLFRTAFRTTIYKYIRKDKKKRRGGGTAAVFFLLKNKNLSGVVTIMFAAKHNSVRG